MRVFPDGWSNGTRVFATIVVVIVVMYVASLAMGSDGDDDDGNTVAASTTTVTAPASNQAMYEVEYRIIVDVPLDIDISWNNATEGLEHSDNTRIGMGEDRAWTRSFTMKSGTYAYITARNQTDAARVRSVRCELLVDGQLVKESEASGPSASVRCDARVGG